VRFHPEGPGGAPASTAAINDDPKEARHENTEDDASQLRRCTAHVAAVGAEQQEAVMNTHIARKQIPMAGEKLRELAELAARVRLMCDTGGMHPQNQSLTATGPWGEPVQIEFIDRQPYGYVFAEGQEASLRVPSGHRFVIEQVNVSSWGDSGTLTMQLVTNAPRLYRCIDVAYLPEQHAAAVVAVTPLVVNGLSANTFLFSDRKVHNSATVPAETYLQIWGYLEPSHFPANDSLYANADASPHRSTQANHNTATR